MTSAKSIRESLLSRSKRFQTVTSLRKELKQLTRLQGDIETAMDEQAVMALRSEVIETGKTVYNMGETLCKMEEENTKK